MLSFNEANNFMVIQVCQINIFSKNTQTLSSNQTGNLNYFYGIIRTIE